MSQVSNTGVVVHDESEKGIGIVELAIVLPVILGILVTLFDFVMMMQSDIRLTDIVDNGYRKATSVWMFQAVPTSKCGLSLNTLTAPASSPGSDSTIEKDIVASLKNSGLHFKDNSVCIEYGTRTIGDPAGPIGFYSTPQTEVYVKVSGKYDGISPLLDDRTFSVTSSGPKLF